MIRFVTGLCVALGAYSAQSTISQVQLPIPGIAEYGLPLALASWVFWCWRQDREEDAKRYAKLATEYKEIVADNTRAITRLADQLTTRPCVARSLGEG